MSEMKKNTRLVEVYGAILNSHAYICPQSTKENITTQTSRLKPLKIISFHRRSVLISDISYY